jgi:hypothetical protein
MRLSYVFSENKLGFVILLGSVPVRCYGITNNLYLKHMIAQYDNNTMRIKYQY